MYESISGVLKEKEPHRAIIEAGGIGYRIAIPLSTYTKLPSSAASLSLYLSFVVREDAQTLYGFIGKQERDLFELLLTISGIGPKTALGIVGHMEMGPFQRAVTTGDTRLLSKLPGIGKKTAERLVLEMRDKFTGKKGKIAPVDLGHSLLSDAVNALMNLGYNPLDSQEAVQEALKEQSEEKDLGRLISLALQKI